MKAKAPEKIYVTINHPVSEEYTEIIAFENGNGIEYTRTDVLIENVCEFLKTNASKHIYFDEGNTEWYDTEELIEDLRKHLKGE